MDQGTAGGGEKGGHKGMRGQGAPGMIELTADQKAKFKAIGAAQAAEAKPVHEKAKVTVKELKALVAAKAGDEAVKAKLAELTAIRATLKDIRDKYQAQREEVLTPSQRAQMAVKMGDRMDSENGDKKDMKGKKGMKCGKSDAPDAKE